MSTDDQDVITFRAPKDFACILSKIAFDLDENKSEIIRKCIQVALPIIMRKTLLKDHPYLSSILNNGEK